MKKNGSAILWVVTVLLIFSVIVFAALGLSQGTHSNAIKSVYKQQAYYTALSYAEAVARAIIIDPNNMAPPTVGNEWTGYQVNFTGDMGTIAELKAKRVSATEITVKAKGQYKGETDTVTLHLYSSGGKVYNNFNASGGQNNYIQSWSLWKYGV